MANPVKVSLLIAITGLSAACASQIPGTYVDPDSKNWTFHASKNPVAVAAVSQVPEFFGLHYRSVPATEAQARNAINAYLTKHMPNCQIFSMNVPDGADRNSSANWGAGLECKQ